jgi:hypothetical protein
MLPKLYDLSAAYAELMGRDDLSPQALSDTLDSINDAIEVKARNSIAVFMELEDYIESCKKREEQFKAWRRTAENRLEWLKGYWEKNMEAMGKTKIQTELGPISLRNSKGMVHIIDSNQIPACYKKTTITETIDKTLIYEAIKDDVKVPGAELVPGKYIKVG